MCLIFSLILGVCIAKSSFVCYCSAPRSRTVEKMTQRWAQGPPSHRIASFPPAFHLPRSVSAPDQFNTPEGESIYCRVDVLNSPQTSQNVASRVLGGRRLR